MDRRSEILRAVAEAAKLTRKYPLNDRAGFDIVGAVVDMDVPLLFRPLKGLWGAAVHIDGADQGILVTTLLGLHVQRFTLAHELGHVLLGHAISLDKTVGFAGRNGPATRPAQEIAADTFASELLASKAILHQSSARHGWTRDALADPTNVYQLSLRIGVSFQATCWALVTAGVFSQHVAERLQSSNVVKRAKAALAPPELITDPWADVWSLSRSDTGTFLEAGPHDLFVVHVQDRASAGFLWKLAEVSRGARIIEERREEPNGQYGASVGRAIYLRFDEPGIHTLVFEHVRPWSRIQIEEIRVGVDGFGKETPGLPRRTLAEQVVRR